MLLLSSNGKRGAGSRAASDEWQKCTYRGAKQKWKEEKPGTATRAQGNDVIDKKIRGLDWWRVRSTYGTAWLVQYVVSRWHKEEKGKTRKKSTMSERVQHWPSSVDSGCNPLQNGRQKTTYPATNNHLMSTMVSAKTPCVVLNPQNKGSVTYSYFITSWEDIGLFMSITLPN